MSQCGLRGFKHDSELGNAHAHALFDRITAKKKIEVLRAFSDSVVAVDESNLPAAVQLIRRGG